MIIGIDLTGLGAVSDYAGIDTVYFFQRQSIPVPVPAAI
jgi:hypothetical protein